MPEFQNIQSEIDPPAKRVRAVPQSKMKSVITDDGRKEYVRFCLVNHVNPKPWISYNHSLPTPTFPEPLFRYQQNEIDRAHIETRIMLQVPPRCGKTRAGLGSLLRARYQRGFGRSLIICPNAIVDVWVAECGLWGVEPIVAGSGGFDRKGRTIKQTKELLHNLPEDALVICNDERLEHLGQDIIDAKFDGLIVDESHRIISRTGIRAEIVRECALRAGWVRMMTGTPVSNSPLDIWAQCSVLRPDIWGEDEQQFVLENLTAYGPEELNVFDPVKYAKMSRSTIHGYSRSDIFAEILAQRALSHGGVWRPSDNWQYITRFVHMPPNAIEQYNKIADNYAEWKKDDSSNAAKGFAIQMQARQITSGFLHPSGQNHWEDLHYQKTHAVIADMMGPVSSGEKMVIFHLFVPEGKRMISEIQKYYPGIPVFEINGTVKESYFDLCKRFNQHEGPAVIVAQIQCASLGLPMHTASHAMFLSKTWRYIDFDQARDRVFKAGEMRSVSSYIVPDTIDVSIENALSRRSNLHVQTIEISRIDPQPRPHVSLQM